MKLEVRNHEVRSSNELPGLPYVCFLIRRSSTNMGSTLNENVVPMEANLYLEG